MRRISIGSFYCKRIATIITANAVGSIILLLCQHGVAQQALNVWSTNGPSEPITSIVVDPNNPNIIFAAAGQSGVVKSTNNGASWSASSQGLGNSFVASLAFDPGHTNTLYAGITGGDSVIGNGVFKTIDGGATWHRTNSPGEIIGPVATAPGHPDIVYSATWNDLLVTLDGGETWTARPFPHPDGANLLVVDPRDPGIIFASFNSCCETYFSSLYKSVDYGVSWVYVSVRNGGGVDTYNISADINNTKILYVATGYGIYKSIDAGVHWISRGSPGPNTETFGLAVDPFIPGTLYIAAFVDVGCFCSTGVYKSTDDGMTWTVFNNGLSNLEAGQLAFDRSGRYLYAATSTGVFSVKVRDGANARSAFDFDGDGRSDVSVFRPSDRVWYLNQSSAGFAATQFGASSDQITPGDFDGDGKTDLAVWRPSTGTWYLQQSTSGFTSVQWGAATDLPVQGDFDGDGKTDIAVWRPSSGTWYVISSASGQASGIQFGQQGDKPAQGDYDGDGKTDLAVYRPSTGTWFIHQSTPGYTAVKFGIPTDQIVPADYDGDGKTDLGVYRDGIWYLLESSSGFNAISFGAASDVPVAADYDGDGKANIAVFRPSNGTWYQLSGNYGFFATQFGQSTDRPIPAAYIP